MVACVTCAHIKSIFSYESAASNGIRFFISRQRRKLHKRRLYKQLRSSNSIRRALFSTKSTWNLLGKCGKMRNQRVIYTSGLVRARRVKVAALTGFGVRHDHPLYKSRTYWLAPMNCLRVIDNPLGHWGWEQLIHLTATAKMVGASTCNASDATFGWRRLGLVWCVPLDWSLANQTKGLNIW